MRTVKVANAQFVKAEYLRRNLRRIFDAWPYGSLSRVARDAGMHPPKLCDILSGKNRNPGINTVEAISIALEISFETLISPNPSDSDLRIPQKTKKAS